MKLYEITKEIREVEKLFIESINHETGEAIDGVSLSTLIEMQEKTESELRNKSAGIIATIKNKEIFINSIDEEIDRLNKLKKTHKTNLDNFKNYIVKNMETMDLKKVETTLGNLSLRSSTSTVILDGAIIPRDDRYFKLEVVESLKFDKTVMKNLIQAGEKIKGVELVKKNSLNIK